VFFVSDPGYCFTILFDQEKGTVGYSKIELKVILWYLFDVFYLFIRYKSKQVWL